MYTRIRNFFVIAVIAAAAVAATVFILRKEPNQPATAEASTEGAGAAEYPRGPHNGRLLTGKPLQIEVTIYETGVPPQFRLYPFDENMKPLPPKEVEVQVELSRLGGRVDRIGFQPESDYLRGDAIVEEPHSFDVKIAGKYGGNQIEWMYSQIEGKVKLEADQLESSGITIKTVGPRQLLTTFELPGEVKTDQTRLAHVVPRLQGIVTDVLKKEGDQVRKGDLLVVLNSRELAEAKSAYLVAGHRVEFARLTMEREEALWKKKITPEQDYLEAKHAFEESVLAETLAAQKLVVLGVPQAALPGLASAPAESMARYEVPAPQDGVVTERDVTVGEAVSAEQRIFTVADLSSVWVDVTVYANDLGAVREGQPVTLLSNDIVGEVSGRISYLGPLVGEETRAATARIVLNNPAGRWRPGLFVTARLVRQAVTVPLAVSADAIQTFRDWQVVFVRYGDWFEARPLELGRRDEKWVEVVEGLSPGERYAATNSFAVKAEIGKLGATHDH